MKVNNPAVIASWASLLDPAIAIANAPTVPFPQWLTDFTGLHEWPHFDPPYIPLDFISFDLLPPVPRHTQGACGAVGPQWCLFDCANCVSYDDVYTCPKLSQTFDDGPSGPTRQLLAGLKHRSTFFTLGLNVVHFPDVYHETMARGHIMGSHTWSHKFLPALTNEEIVAQVQWSVWAMNATAGHLPKWFRPPYGGTDDRVRGIVRQFGMQTVLWDFDTLDWKMLAENAPNSRTERDIYAELDKFKQTNGGRGLILEHDVHSRTVGVALNIASKLERPLTVPQCVGGIDYIKQFPRD
ncbi:carbohydrate esterase family 4 protein [Suhomyces tanzawaensis NRRL Y-17324]|uniref:chitin deacetylase n=1 Tax=Suhomyces tanzawaensis NRRL Y-17324 TaxID=984487 RepID=A0A1E4SCJ1_9ASCO|nr:carbohydrate esterase family 4 protein [Suhomyces tanzawaensis NRRL Y-17324]ODV77215.1 carbohydrate esterase family 4 protein [Suhomyces tanzawaensis NRRL Y-17324]